MGRPLNKKYFGNRNLTMRSAEISNGQLNPGAEIGGESIASFTSIVAGSGWTTDPLAYVNSPEIANGVQAAIIPHYKALSFATTANGTGYAVGDILEVNTGTETTKARAPVANILIVNTPNIQNGGSLYDINSPTDGDKVTYTHTHLSVPFRVRITAVTGSTATQIVVEQAGVWTGSGAPPTSMADGVNGFTATTTAKTGGDTNGYGLVLNGIQWGVYSFGSVTVAGDYTGFPDLSTSLGAVTGTGMNAEADITLGLLSVTVTNQGSGYASATGDALLRFDSSANGASAVTVLTTDSGAIGSSTNRENAIIAYAWLGGSAHEVDIQKQESKDRYRVNANGEEAPRGAHIAKLRYDAEIDGTAYFTTAEGVQMNIVAFDSDGGTYLIRKLTNNRAIVYPMDIERLSSSAGLQFAAGKSVPWTFNGTSGTVVDNNHPLLESGKNVQIENA